MKEGTAKQKELHGGRGRETRYKEKIGNKNGNSKLFQRL